MAATAASPQLLSHALHTCMCVLTLQQLYSHQHAVLQAYRAAKPSHSTQTLSCVSQPTQTGTPALFSRFETLMCLQHASALVQSGFATLASTLPAAAAAPAGSCSTAHSKWTRAIAKSRASNSAAEMTAAARLRALQKTPFPMVIARMKVIQHARNQLHL